MSNLSLNNQRTYLNIFFQWCVDNEYINRNPCIKIPPFKFEKKEREPLTDVEMESLRSVCIDYRDRAIVETLYSTACRVDELINIELNDIDFCARTVKVLGKGNKHRTVYLNARAMVALTEYLEHREFNSPYVFISSKAPFNNLTTRTIENIVKRLGIKAGISGRVFPHRIRHTTATDAIKHGADVVQVQKLLGHESISTTMIYVKTDNTDVQQSCQKYII